MRHAPFSIRRYDGVCLFALVPFGSGSFSKKVPPRCVRPRANKPQWLLLAYTTRKRQYCSKMRTAARVLSRVARRRLHTFISSAGGEVRASTAADIQQFLIKKSLRLPRKVSNNFNYKFCVLLIEAASAHPTCHGVGHGLSHERCRGAKIRRLCRSNNI
jgi:hypothetical protein